MVKKTALVIRRIFAIALPPRLCRWFLLRSFAFARRNFADALMMVEQFEAAAKKVDDKTERAVHDGNLRELRIRITDQQNTFDDIVKRVAGAIEQAALIAKDRSFATRESQHSMDRVTTVANRKI